MKVKLCGFSEENSLKVAIDNGADFIGFVFCQKSPRNILTKQAAHLAQFVPKNIAKVAVVVDANLDLLQEIYDNLKPQYFQLHGNENRQKIIEIKQNFPKIKIIKALHIQNSQNLEQSLDFVDLV
ncbi:MAG TPA: hypothetical protein VI861_04460, partial [Rickettsiales bacterium]|nr:hypothetical protein [Rickettsiales bacterium]